MMLRVFRHFVPTAVIVLVVLDALVLVGSMHLGIWLRFTAGESSGLADHLPILPRALAFMAVIMGSMTAFGVYMRDTTSDRIGFWLRFAAAFVVGFVIMSTLLYAFKDISVWRGAFGLSLFLAMSGMALVRIGFFAIRHNSLRKRLLVLGTGTRAAQVEQVLGKHGLTGKFDIIGYVPTGTSHGHVDPKKVLRHNGSLLGLAMKHGVHEVVVAVRDRRGGNLAMQELLECKIEGINVVELSSFFERETGHVRVDSLNPSWLVFSDGFCRSSTQSMVKRIFDIVVSGTVLVLTFPVLILTALAVRFESRGPVFYRQARVGECGHVFQILKFRSMRADAESAGTAIWAAKGDNRVTRVGRIIRALRIDELPQIFNVLLGDMSFVGPRPERPMFVDQLSKQIPYYPNRHAVKPGITGWAQVNYPYGASVEDAREKLQYDLYYIKNHSVFLDFLIIAQTAQVVLFARGAR